jgi:uncharacterized pyridoxamine 5'-phosphate oxidase family protein
MNKIDFCKSAMFHAQNIPAKWKYLWDEFVCCMVDKTTSFNDVTVFDNGTPFVGKHFARVLDYLFVFGDAGIWYIDYDTAEVKPTSKLDGEFTWAGAAKDRIWFGGDPGTGFWYSLLSDPFTIIQSNISTGTAYGTGIVSSLIYPHISFFENSVFLSSNGGYYFDPSDSLLKPNQHVPQDFKYAFDYAYGSSEHGLWKYNGDEFAQIVNGFFYGNVVDEKGNFVFFEESGVELINRGAVTSIHVNMVARRGELDRSYRLVLACETGLLLKDGTALDSSRGYKWITIGTDGYLYMCGNDGKIYYWDDYKEVVVDTGKNGNYTESIVGHDGKIYFAGNDIVRLELTPAGNTGYAVAMKLQLHRIKYGKNIIQATFSMLNSISPEINIAELKKLTQADIEQRAADIWQSVSAIKEGMSPENSPYENNPTMCEIGESGFSSGILLGSLWVVPPSDNYKSSIAYSPILISNLGQMNHTWGSSGVMLNIAYFDNISAWESGRNKIILNGINAGNQFWKVPTIGFIELPPEEWIIDTPNSMYDAIIQKIGASKNKVTFPVTATSFDISNIYENENAKTLILYSTEIPNHYNGYKNVLLQNVRITINDEPLHLRFYKMLIMEWSNRVLNGDNNIAKTLTVNVAVANTSETYSILDAFGTHSAMTEQAYLALPVADIFQRADDLMAYIAGQIGRTRFKELNEVIVTMILEIVQTNKTDGNFAYAAIGQDGKLYFCGYAGIYRLENNGNIVVTNKTNGAFDFVALGQDNKLYFCAASGSDSFIVYRLENNGEIVVAGTIPDNRYIKFLTLGQDNKLYFCSNAGIYRLENNGEIVVTNKTNGNFTYAVLGQDNKLYFCAGSGSTGIYRLENNGEIVIAGEIYEYFNHAALGQDNKLYFCSNTGIYRLENNGNIVVTNKTNGNFKFAALGQDNKLYFCSYSNDGILRLDLVEEE